MSAATSTTTSPLAPLARLARECGVRLCFGLQDSTRPRVLVLPSYGPDDGASLLRGWNLAAALRDCGWRATAVPHQLTLAQRLRLIRRERPGVLLIQQARHPLNRPALYRDTGVPVVFDLDDADWLDENCAQPLVDCCRDAWAVIAGSRFVAEWCQQHNPRTSVVWTGTPMPSLGSRSTVPFPPPQNRSPIITWAQADPMRCPHEAGFVIDVLLELARRNARFSFRLYGLRAENTAAINDYVAPLRAGGVNVQMLPHTDYRRFTQSLCDVAIGLQPVAPDSPYSQGKSFGKVLAYIASGVAVVASDALDHPLFFRNAHNGILAANDPKQWANGVERLLYDPHLRRRLAQRAYADAASKLSTAAAAGAVNLVLRAELRRARRHDVDGAQTNEEESRRRQHCCPAT